MSWGKVIGWGFAVWVVAVAIDLPGIVVAAVKATDPINGLITSVGHSCERPACRTSLVSGVFRRGESRDDVRARLLAVRYKGDGDTYWREDHINPKFLSSLVCEVSYRVELEFDQHARLLNAAGDPEVWCF